MGEKFKLEPWFDMSAGDYVLTGAVVFGHPLGFYPSGLAIQDANANNKITLCAYQDYNGVYACPGVAYESRYAYQTYTTQDIYAETGGFRREIGVLHEGYLKMVYVTGAGTLQYGDPIAPHPSGFQDWAPGMFLLGKVAAEVPPGTGQLVRIKLNPQNESLLGSILGGLDTYLDAHLEEVVDIFTEALAASGILIAPYVKTYLQSATAKTDLADYVAAWYTGATNAWFNVAVDDYIESASGIADLSGMLLDSTIKTELSGLSARAWV